MAVVCGVMMWTATRILICFADKESAAMRGLRPHGRPQSSLETSCGARMRTDVTLLAYHPGDGRSPRAVIQPVGYQRLGLGGAVD